MWATRISFAGELGWELTVQNDHARRVLDAVRRVGAAHSLGYAGHWCLDGLRMEKGYRHWGHDIGPDDSPLQAGLGFTVCWDKQGGFQGRDALLRQRDIGIDRHLMLFAVEGGRPLILHDEPIYRNGLRACAPPRNLSSGNPSGYLH